MITVTPLAQEQESGVSLLYLKKDGEIEGHHAFFRDCYKPLISKKNSIHSYVFCSFLKSDCCLIISEKYVVASLPKNCLYGALILGLT